MKVNQYFDCKFGYCTPATNLFYGDEDIPVISAIITDCNFLKVSVGTNGFWGGDAGHGSRTFLEIKDEAGSCLEGEAIVNGDEIKGFRLVLGGDAELRTLIQALKFAADALDELANKGKIEIEPIKEEI